MVDPLSIVVSSATLAVLCGKLAVSIHEFIEGATNVDDNVASMYREVDGLSKIIDAISRCKLGRAELELFLEKSGEELIGSLHASLDNCRNTLEGLECVLAGIKQSRFLGWSGRPGRQIRLALKTKDISIYRSQIQAHTQDMQLSLGVLSLCLHLKDRHDSTEILHVLHELESQIQALSRRPSAIAADITTGSQGRPLDLSHQRLVVAAESVCSSASIFIHGSIKTSSQSILSTSSSSDDDDDKEFVQKLRQLALATFRDGKHQSAVGYLTRLLKSLAPYVSFADKNEARVMLAMSQTYIGRWEEVDPSVLLPANCPTRNGTGQHRQLHLIHAAALHHLTEKRLDAALECCRRAMKGKKKLTGKSSDSYAESLALLARIYDAMGDSVSAEVCRELLPEQQSHTDALVDPQSYVKWAFHLDRAETDYIPDAAVAPPVERRAPEAAAGKEQHQKSRMVVAYSMEDWHTSVAFSFVDKVGKATNVEDFTSWPNECSSIRSTYRTLNNRIYVISDGEILPLTHRRSPAKISLDTAYRDGFPDGNDSSYVTMDEFLSRQGSGQRVEVMKRISPRVFAQLYRDRLKSQQCAEDYRLYSELLLRYFCLVQEFVSADLRARIDTLDYEKVEECVTYFVLPLFFYGLKGNNELRDSFMQLIKTPSTSSIKFSPIRFIDPEIGRLCRLIHHLRIPLQNDQYVVHLQCESQTLSFAVFRVLEAQPFIAEQVMPFVQISYWDQMIKQARERLGRKLLQAVNSTEGSPKESGVQELLSRWAADYTNLNPMALWGVAHRLDSETTMSPFMTRIPDELRASLPDHQPDLGIYNGMLGFNAEESYSLFRTQLDFIGSEFDKVLGRVPKYAMQTVLFFEWDSSLHPDIRNHLHDLMHKRQRSGRVETVVCQPNCVPHSHGLTARNAVLSDLPLIDSNRDIAREDPEIWGDYREVIEQGFQRRPRPQKPWSVLLRGYCNDCWQPVTGLEGADDERRMQEQAFGTSAVSVSLEAGPAIRMS